MDLTKLEEVLKNEPGYRLKQAEKLIYQDFIENWDEANVLPLALREGLNKKCPLKINIEASVSNDEKSIKALVFLSDKLKIETVLMRHKDGRNTVCVSCQVGCPLGCSFCATGKIGFKRNLTAYEIVEQVIFFSRFLKSKGEKVSNIVFMGMGEPFLNYDNVLGAIKILNNPEGFGLGARHFSISTVGIIEGINKLAEEKLQVNLAVSLHAPNDKLRVSIMPINKKYQIKEIMGAVGEYVKRTKRRVMFEYIMIENVNDSDKEALELVKLMKNSLYFVNLILCNPTGTFRPSSSERIKRFKEILKKKGVSVTKRYRFGTEIKAACGQLVARNN